MEAIPIGLEATLQFKETLKAPRILAKYRQVEVSSSIKQISSEKQGKRNRHTTKIGNRGFQKESKVSNIATSYINPVHFKTSQTVTSLQHTTSPHNTSAHQITMHIMPGIPHKLFMSPAISNKKLLGTSASLLVTSALLVVTRSY